MMGLRSFGVRGLAIVGLALSFNVGCSSSDEAPGQTSAPSVALDPAQEHYGFSNDTWGTRWWKWIYEAPQTDAENCIIPFMDQTGEHCAYGQPGGDVFFLAGTLGGAAVRDKCTVPSGAAIYFPILGFTGDNAGVPPEKQLSPEDLKAYLQSQADAVPVSELSVEFDGQSVPDLGRFRTEVTEFDYFLPPEPNIYTCQGATGVTGEVKQAFATGFYVMLAPPAVGHHVLHFKGSAPESSPPNGLEVNVTYNLTIE